MNSLDLFRFVFRNFARHKVMTFLTVIGVIIGTAAIVVMLSLGIGMKESFVKQIGRMGNFNVITVTPNYLEGEPRQSDKAILNDNAVVKISKIDGVEAVMPILQANLKILSGKYMTSCNVMGIDPAIIAKFDLKINSGRILKSADTASILFGSRIPGSFSNTRMEEYGSKRFYTEAEEDTSYVDVLNDKLEMTFDMNYGVKKTPVIIQQESNVNNKPAKLYKVKGIGVLTRNNDTDFNVYMNINYLKRLIRENKSQNANFTQTNKVQGYQQVMVKARDINDVVVIQKKIGKLGFGTQSLVDVLKSVQKTAASIQTVLGGIGAVSLLIAALGITNTMIMSIMERTREIGIMKVLGCLLKDIRKLFLMEAGIIGFIGGIFGLIISTMASYLLNIIGNGVLNRQVDRNSECSNISVIPLWLALFSIGFSTLVGIVSGFYPARRAMKLSVLDAIKNE